MKLYKVSTIDSLGREQDNYIAAEDMYTAMNAVLPLQKTLTIESFTFIGNVLVASGTAKKADVPAEFGSLEELEKSGISADGQPIKTSAEMMPSNEGKKVLCPMCKGAKKCDYPMQDGGTKLVDCPNCMASGEVWE